MTTAKKILISSGGWQGSLATMQSLGRLGHHPYLLANNQETPAIHSKYCKGFFITPRVEQEKEYLSCLIQILSENKFVGFIPISDQVVSLISRHRAQLLNMTKFILPDEKTVDLTVNKTNTYHFCLQNNIPIPETYFPQSWADILEISKKNIFPCFIKYPMGSAGNNNMFVERPNQLIEFFKSKERTEIWKMANFYC